MIKITLDRLNEDVDYEISGIDIFIKEPKEKERIEKLLIEKNIVGEYINLDYDGGTVKKQIAQFFGVDENLIDFDANITDI